MAKNRISEQEQVDVSRRAGRQLAMAFTNGATPQPVPVRLTLRPREVCVGQVPVVVSQWLEGDGSYTKRRGGWVIGGGVLGAAFSAASIATSVVGNAARKSRAAHDAAGQWRRVDAGTAFLTSQRWSIQGSTTWLDLWFTDVRMSDCDSRSIILELNQMPHTSLEIPAPDYWYVMFNKLAFDTVAMPQPPSDGVDLP